VTPWPPTDSQALAELLELHVPAGPRILDCTYGRGRVWGHLPVRQSVIKVDINCELPGLDLVADWRELPRHYAQGAIDCLVWDPIHVADVGRTSQFYGRYVAPQNPVKGDNVTHLYPCFLEVAAWLVKPRTGVCLVKLCDQVHSGRQQWQVMNFVCEAQRRGWTACDYTIVQNATGVRKDPKHKAKYHVRNQWAFWIVLRNGPACHGPGRRSSTSWCARPAANPFGRVDRTPGRTTTLAARRCGECFGEARARHVRQRGEHCGRDHVANDTRHGRRCAASGVVYQPS